MVVTFKVAQNGGEYYGYAKLKGVKGEVVKRLDYNTFRIDDLEISFDEHAEISSIVSGENESNS